VFIKVYSRYTHAGEGRSGEALGKATISVGTRRDNIAKMKEE
jgi:hypothetical protein